MRNDPPDPAALEQTIAELLENGAELAEASLVNARVLAELLAEHGGLAAVVVSPGDLDPEVRDIAEVYAEAEGVTLTEFVASAVLAYIGGAPKRPGLSDQDLARRLRHARQGAQRLQDENRAVKAQSAQAQAPSARLGVQRRAAQKRD